MPKKQQRQRAVTGGAAQEWGWLIWRAEGRGQVLVEGTHLLRHNEVHPPLHLPNIPCDNTVVAGHGKIGREAVHAACSSDMAFILFHPFS